MLRYALIMSVLISALGAMAQHCTDKSEEQCTPESATTTSFNQDTDWSKASSIYDFHARDIHGNDVPLSKYSGHVAIIVNVASDCGLTEQNYQQLVQLYEKYNESKGLKILAFPSNQFGEQEPGTPDQILDFVKQYKVTFDMFEKIDVNGDSAHPLWKWLKTQASGFLTDDIKWNFSKFIINKEGKVVSRHSPTTDPLELEPELISLF